MVAGRRHCGWPEAVVLGCIACLLALAVHAAPADSSPHPQMWTHR
jgi:hypothetical protein